MSNLLSVDVKTNLSEELPQQILFNYDALKTELSETLEKYQGVVVTKDAIKDAKDTRASLNNFKKSLNATRIAIGKEWNKPYDAFKAKVDELIAMVDEPTAAIDIQIKDFEDAEKEEKRAAITEFYIQNVAELSDILPLERIWDDRWLNKGTALNAATNQLFDRMDAIRKDLKTIETMEIDHKDYLLNSYLRTLNIGTALDERRKYDDEQKALKRRQEAIATPQASPPVAPPPFSPEITTSPTPMAEITRDLELRFMGTTKAFRQELKAVCARHGFVHGTNYFGGIINGA